MPQKSLDFQQESGCSGQNPRLWAENGESDGVNDDGSPLEPDKNLVEFCKAYKEAKELQKEFLIHNGLVGAANAPVTIFTAKNVTDMRDQVDVDVNKTETKILEIGPNLAKIYGESSKELPEGVGEVIIDS